MSIIFLAIPLTAAVCPLLLSRYLKRARSRRCLERLEDALSFDVPRPWHRDMRHVLRSADDQLLLVDHSVPNKKATEGLRPRLSPNPVVETEKA
jgi:Flp pilus assembly CpaE family ATPase